MKMKIGFIGLGLIGGSLAKAIRQYYPDCEITAFDKNKETLALATLESSTSPPRPWTIIFTAAVISFYVRRSPAIPLI